MENSLADPMVSVVIPTIKYDDYTEAALMSIVSQNYQNWEIVLVLDGASIADVPGWVLEDTRVKIVEHPERLGTPTSLNDGVAVSSGEFIARLDSDDIAHPDRLAYQIRFLQEDEAICCIGTGGYLIDSNSVCIGMMQSHPMNLDIRRELLRKNMLVHSSVMYRKKIFEAVGGYNPVMIRMQDYDLFLRMAHKAPIAYSNESLCAYRTHPGQHSRKTSPFRRYTLEIVKQRNSLRSALKAPRATQYLDNIKWYGAQLLRYTGIRKPGYILNSGLQSGSQVDLGWIKE